MNIKCEIRELTFTQALTNAKVIFELSKNIPCEGLRYEMRFLAAWITIHIRRINECELSNRDKIRSIKQALFLLEEVHRCLWYLHDSGELSTNLFHELEKTYHLISAQLGQWKKDAESRRWLGRIIRFRPNQNLQQTGTTPDMDSNVLGTGQIKVHQDLPWRKIKEGRFST